MPKNHANLSIGFLFDDTLDSNDGVSQYVKTLGAWLSDRGHSVSYLVGQTKLESWHGGRVFSMARNVRVIFNGNRLSIPLPASRRLIKGILAANDFDVLHVQVPYSPFMSQMVINRADPATAVVGTFHILPSGWLARWGTKALGLVCWRSLRRFGEIVSVGPAAAVFAKQSFGVNSQVLPNVVSLKGLKPNKQPSRKTGEIVFLGRLVKRKGCLELLKAFKLAHDQQNDIHLTIAGDGPQRAQLQSYVKQNHLEESVDFLGFIDEKAKPELLAGAAIACFPSLYGESFGIVLIEAMAAGAGVVLGGNNPGYQGVLGAKPELLIDPRDSSVFAARLLKLLDDERLANGLHAWQSATVKQYDVEIVGKKIENLYRANIAKVRPTSHNKRYAV